MSIDVSFFFVYKFALQSDRKWSLSGTPMQNRVGELYSLIRFMQADPFG